MSDLFKLIIAGGRDFSDAQTLGTNVVAFLKSQGITQTEQLEIVSGMARGADRLGHQFATLNKCAIAEFPAKWGTYGKSAGYRRNAEMAKYADALIAFWDGESRGTQHMILTMQQLNKPVAIVEY